MNSLPVFATPDLRHRAVPARGFTLIELLVTVAIIGILAAIAVPNYSAYVTRSALSAGTGNLADLRARMEQFYLDRRTYAAGGNCGVNAAAANNDHFTFTCALPSAGVGYTLTATGKDRAAGFVYTLNQANVRATTGSPSASPWNGRTSASEWIIR